jgi:very-short-patch-repair endonuclease
MRPEAIEQARERQGVVPLPDLGSHAVRDAPGRGLRRVQLRAYLAETQPYDVPAQLASLLVTHREGWWLRAGSALWAYDVAGPPEDLEVAIELSSELVVRPPVRARRLSPSVLAGTRVVAGSPVVALEIAAIQWAHRRPHTEVVRLIEKLLRERRTTVVRLRSRLGRGIAGSTAVRRALDELLGGSLDRDVRELKRALERLGVTGLECEVRFVSATGASAYADLLHRPTMTLIEVDGVLDHAAPDRFLTDRRRDRWMLRDHGARTLRVDLREVRRDVDALARELAGFLLPAAA